jgi:UPF0042 nucleotide-binding protein
MERVVVITGLSGSGKSLAVRSLEDLGFFCVDNLPVLLIPPFIELLQRSAEAVHGAALVIDVRERIFLDQFPETLRGLREKGVHFLVLFFESSDDVLKRRFSESRRPHPMIHAAGTLEEAIRRERAALHPIRELADRIVDTSRFTVHDIRAFLKNAFGDVTGQKGPNVNVVSFGFKYGIPAESDLVFDVRFLPNPFFDAGLRPLDGTAPQVRAFLDAQVETGQFMTRLQGMLDYLIPLYAAEGKTYLTVSLGCTGGRHRSVGLAESLKSYLDDRGIPATVHHRDLGRE